jgi:hypothetical protein
MTDDLERWQEEDSEHFIERGDIITPSRAEQLRMVTGLIPAEPEQEFLAVDLACGPGSLSGAVLARFPRSRVVALDGSPTMLTEARRRFGIFGDRVECREFDLSMTPGWIVCRCRRSASCRRWRSIIWMRTRRKGSMAASMTDCFPVAPASD